jgi:membrane protease YdiL (CAAX protease family)
LRREPPGGAPGGVDRGPDPRHGLGSDPASDGPSPYDGPAAGLPDDDGLPPPGPPGGRVFTVEDRPAPGLYLVSWLLAVGGVAVLVVGGLTQSRGIALLLAVAGLASLGLGLAAAAGYQVIARRDRHPAAYRGPSPLVVFGVALALSTVVAALAFAFGLGDPAAPIGFLGGLTIVALAYAVSVWLLVVRTDALSWREMGWPVAGRPAALRVLADIGFAVALTIPATFAVLIFAGIVGRLLGVEAPDILPAPRTSLEALAVAVAAAFVAPIGEELFFRGFALSAWQRDLGPRSALVRSSFFFAIVHIANVTATTFGEGAAQAVLQFVVILPLGALLGWLFQQRGIAASIAGHVAYNGLLLLLLFLASRLGPLPTG